MTNTCFQSCFGKSLTLEWRVPIMGEVLIFWTGNSAAICQNILLSLTALIVWSMFIFHWLLCVLVRLSSTRWWIFRVSTVWRPCCCTCIIVSRLLLNDFLDFSGQNKKKMCFYPVWFRLSFYTVGRIFCALFFPATLTKHFPLSLTAAPVETSLYSHTRVCNIGVSKIYWTLCIELLIGITVGCISGIKSTSQLGMTGHVGWMGDRILAINNYYRLIRIINGYIDYFYIRIKDLYGLLNSQHPTINLYKSVLIGINLYLDDIFFHFWYLHLLNFQVS